MRNIGRLDKKIQLVKRDFTNKSGRGVFGEINDTSTYIDTTTEEVFAYVDEQFGNEINNNDKQTGVNRVLFQIRHTSGISIKDTKIIYDNREFDIVHIKPNRHNRLDSLLLTTEEIV